MAAAFSSNESVIGYVTNVSNENKKKKYYIKFTMQSENNRLIDGWVFSGVTGILTTPLGIALTNSVKNHTGLRLWGKIEENAGLTVFKTQSWSKFQKANPGFLFESQKKDLLCVRDALMSIEPCSIRIFVIDIRPTESFDKHGVLFTNTFILIGDESGTTYLAASNIIPETFVVEQTYDLTQVRRKMFNGMPIISITINTQISSSITPVIADISEVAKTLSLDLCDKKTTISSIDEVGPLTRSIGCSTCKGDLTDVIEAAVLAYCKNCRRHSLKKNINQYMSTTFGIKDGEEKIVLWASSKIVEQLLGLVGLSVDANETEIAMTLLSHGDLHFEYSELRKDIMAVSKP